MTEVISVRFDNNKVFFFDPGGLTVKRGAGVIVDTVKGRNFGECVYGNHSVEDSAIVKPLRPVVRLATDDDRRRVVENSEKKTEAFTVCRRKIAEYKLPMKLVSIEYSFDGNKLVFYFTANSRVDFRELVKEMAATFKTRIELRQIGVRDEARVVGGLGICGRPFCCSQFLRNFHPVSIKMAKTQGLSLNPTKISGACGRLMCCLKYEEAAYVDIVKQAPKTDSFVETPSGKGTIVSVNLLRGNARVRLEDGTDTALKTFDFGEMVVLGGKLRRAEYVAAKAEGRLKEAGFSEQPPPELAALAKHDVSKLDEVLFSLSGDSGKESAAGAARVPRPAPQPHVRPDARDKLDRTLSSKPTREPRDDIIFAKDNARQKKGKRWKDQGGGGAARKNKPPKTP
ncbi:MAG: stage 0 sporulation family protein [Oscillospiraceae bacterium]|nr:stage 0 sporulation family protein [Oscillospiraceae bacterium]